MRSILIFSLLFSSLIFANEKEEDEDTKPPVEEQLIVVDQMISIDGKTLEYQTLTGRIPIFNQEGEESARIFFIAYAKKNPEEARPLTFVFPGGPGGSCCPESICSFGPKRLPLTTEGKPARPPYSLIDNKQTLLFETDLIFVDPVETGFSTLTNEDDADFYHTATGDMISLSMFIGNYLSSFKKWNSPIFLSGSSYGTTRACGVGYILNAYFNIPVRGLILMGNCINLDLYWEGRDRHLTDCLVLPTFAATAWYHGRFWPEKPLSEVVDYARRFAYDDYAPAMAQPNRMDRYTKERFFKELAELTGLPETTIRKYNGRINEEIFTTEFFSPERKILGGLDTRYVGDQSSIKRWSTEEDPSYREELRGLMPTFIHYLQTELEGGCGHLSYVPFSRQPWFFNVMDLMEWLRRALVINPDLQVFSANGYYDCRTPFLAAEYCIDHLDLPESYANNIEFKYYEAGHGLIFDADALQQLQTDLVGFYAK